MSEFDDGFYSIHSGNSSDSRDPLFGWTVLGMPTAHDTNTTWPSHYYVTKASGGISLSGIYKAIPTMPFTVTCKLTADNILADPQARAGLFVAEATPGKVASVSRLLNTSLALASDIWTNPTTFGGNTTVLNLGGAPGIPLYLRLIVASSTDLTYQYSYNGRFWMTLGSASHNPSMTIGSVGLFVNPGSAGVAIAAAFDWIRFA